MTTVFNIIALLLFISFLIAMIRVFVGPAKGDRILSLQLLGTTGTAILLVLTINEQFIGLIDIAIVLVLLASISTTVFVFSSRTISIKEEDE